MSKTSFIGRTLKDRYVVEEPLGAGGMGSVYLGQDKDLARPVVIKVPHGTLLTQPGFLIRFQKEIGNLLKLEHKNVVKVVDAGTTEDELPYLVLQYLRGGNLEDRLAQPISAEEVLDWLQPVAEALDFIHARGYVHRDIKPANILFDDQGHPYVADFGITKALGDENTMVTAPGYTPGTPNYMAPEAESVNPLTGAYDQYALAVVVYQALSNSIPHQGTTPYEILNAKKTQKPQPLSKVAPELPPAVTRAVMVALEKEPRDRYPTCKSFAMAFDEAFRQSRQSAKPAGSSRAYWIGGGALAVAAGLVAWAALGRGGGDDGDDGGSSDDSSLATIVPGGTQPKQGEGGTGPGQGGDDEGTPADDPAAEPGEQPGEQPDRDAAVETPGDVPADVPGDVPKAAAPVAWSDVSDALTIAFDVSVDVALSGEATVDREALARHARARWATALAKQGLSVKESEEADLEVRAQYSLKANEVFGNWMGLGEASVQVLEDGAVVAGWDDAVGPGDPRKAPGVSAMASATGVLSSLVGSNAEDLVVREAPKAGFLSRTVVVVLPEGIDPAVVRRNLEGAGSQFEVSTDADGLSVSLQRGSLAQLARYLRSLRFGDGDELAVESFDPVRGRLVLRAAG